MILADEAATRALGARLAARLRPGDIVTLSGALGAGKTTLARGLIAALGHEGEVPSPSFALVQPYDALNLPLWHADLYRLDDPAELDELGLETVLADGALLVEWPEHGGANAFPGALRLAFHEAPGGARRLTAQVPAAWEDRWPPQ
ncbi:tRNA (adenosine(37)-N6)-threonylcarbamoyltransferase complex ATPase subunit type 1 TsaE [Sphingomonas sp. ASV193]|uniref:tRNA (adenosine(37)-N6)-threonylcarbamoyltransferase complex ATPase subunit type 1 TsaE n=1 Tax=Sphingomonas sp. ASV193 TaxID=3144405 RepID=UPI0032E868E0